MNSMNTLMNSRLSLRNKQSGQVMIGVALAMVVLAGFAGLAIDMGTLRYERRVQQSAADASALAGASELNFTGGSISTAAQTASTQNGFTDGGTSSLATCDPSGGTTPAIGTTCVQILNPPADVSFNGGTIGGGPHKSGTTASQYVEVLVAKVQPTYFMNIFGVGSQVVVARAVATNTSGGAGSGTGCIYTLGTPAAKLKISTAGVGVSGNSTVNAPTCGIVDNGNFDANGNVSVYAGAIGVGGASGLPSGQPSSCSNFSAGTTGVCPPPVTGMPYSGDPFASKFSPPSGYGASRGPIKITGGSCAGAGCAPTGLTAVSCTAASCIVPSGVYDDICIDNNQIVNFNAGLYVITGASTCSSGISFNVNANSTVCNSTNANCSGMVTSQNAGVTFYMVGSNTANVDGTAQVQLAAPNSGTYEALLFYQDPSGSPSKPMSLSGNSNSLYQGAIYGPTLDLQFGGNAGFNNGAAYTIIVTNQMDTAGNPYVNLASNLSGLANGGGPIAGIINVSTLVE